MTSLNIHFEGHKEFSTLEKLLNQGIPFNVSFTPYDFVDYERQGPRHPHIVISLIKDGIKAGLITMGQQGYKHKCKYYHKIADPWHENFCFYNKPLSLEEQIELMAKGKELIANTLGTEPIIYVPPNHMYDKTTLEVAKILGYEYVADSALLKLNSYGGEIIIVPESKINSNNSEVLYIHYDEIEKYQNTFWKFFTRNLRSLTEIKALSESKLAIDINTKIKHASKHFKDFRRLFKN